jgi:hypothetical protein
MTGSNMSSTGVPRRLKQKNKNKQETKTKQGESSRTSIIPNSQRSGTEIKRSFS